MKSQRPVTIGEVSAAIGERSLAETETLLDDLVHEGLLQKDAARTPVYWCFPEPRVKYTAMKRPRILIDVDGVLANFVQHSLPVLEELTGQAWKMEDFHAWDLFDTIDRKYEAPFFDAVNKLGWCRSIPVYPGAQEGIKAVQEVGEVYIVTSPMNHVPTWTHEREGWLKEHFGIPHKKVVHTSAKYLCIGDILLDDKPANIESWAKEHPRGLGLLWDQPYNRSQEVGRRVSTWAEVVSAVSSFARLDQNTWSNEYVAHHGRSAIGGTPPVLAAPRKRTRMQSRMKRRKPSPRSLPHSRPKTSSSPWRSRS